MLFWEYKKLSYDKGRVSYVHGKHNKNQKSFFVKATQIFTHSLKCNFYGKNGHISQSCSYKKNSFDYDVHEWISRKQYPKKQDTNLKGSKMIWVPKIK